jgi:hypothetical protein
MSQTSYPTSMTKAFAGQIADLTDVRHVDSLLNGEASANLPFGVAVAKGASDSECLLPAASTDKILGITVRDLSRNSASLSGNGAIAPDDMASVMSAGSVYALPEQAVVKGDKVFVRYTDGGGSLTVGRLRKDGGGNAQVSTLTPTPVNSTPYFVAIDGLRFDYTSDGSATAAEIVAALLAKINALTAKHGVVASGTNTLILTGQTSGVAFNVQADANMAIAATTAPAGIAVELKGAEWAEAGSADEPTKLKLNLPA